MTSRKREWLVSWTRTFRLDLRKVDLSQVDLRKEMDLLSRRPLSDLHKVLSVELV